MSLYTRLRTHGTLAEAPGDIPDAVFALPSTLHWMRAEAILVRELDVNFGTARHTYRTVQRRAMTDREANSVFEQLLFSLNQIAALRALNAAPNKADVARVGIVTWYYGHYGAASAMIAAADGSFPETHATTAMQWDRQIVAANLSMPPFSDWIADLGADLDVSLAAVRARGRHSLTLTPATPAQAWGCHAEYLSGTAKWERDNLEQRVRGSREFRELGVENFRTKAARELRDRAFAGRSISFLHQASRYRGKANYRDAIYLAYGRAVTQQADGFIDDLLSVLTGFSAMAAAYCSIRMGRALWEPFIDDLETGRAISISPYEVWSEA